MKNKEHLKKIGYDTLLNIVSYGLPILMLQCIIFPYIAKEWGSVEYGLMLTLTAVVNVAAEMVGGTLANVRLINEGEYKKRGILGDYKRLLALSISIFLVILLLIFAHFFKQNIYGLTLLTSYYLLFTLRSYFSVSYRIDLKYRSVFINNVLLCIGYGIGLLVTFLLHHWAYIFIVGYTIAMVHLLLTSNMWKEPIKKTALYDYTRNKYISLSGAYLIGNSMNYFDRLFLLATIGATGVGHYYISCVFGKVLNLLTAPVNMVMLSYLSRKKLLTFHELLISIAFLIGLVGGFVIVTDLFGMNMIKILYPEYVNDVRPLIMICTFATALTACTSLFKTLSMRYNTGKSVLIIELIYMVVYICLALLLIKNWSIRGFCISIIVAAVIRVSLFIVGLLKKCHV